MATELNGERRCGAAMVCTLLLLMGYLTSVDAKPSAASARGEPPAAYGVKQRGQPGNPGTRLYDVNTVETQLGTVVSIDRISTEVNAGGIHLTLDTGNERLPIHLGPAWYLEEQSLLIAINDEIEVLGSRVVIDSAPALIAAEIKIDDTLIILRDRNGIPQWRYRGRRGRSS